MENKSAIEVLRVWVLKDGAGRVHPIRLARPAPDNPEVLGRLSVKCMPPNWEEIPLGAVPEGPQEEKDE